MKANGLQSRSQIWPLNTLNSLKMTVIPMYGYSNFRKGNKFPTEKYGNRVNYDVISGYNYKNDV